MQDIAVRNIEVIDHGKRVSNSIAMLVILVSLSMLFATLMLGYIFYRFTANVWPPMGMQRVDLFFPTLSTLIIAVSSYCYYLFEASYKEGPKHFKKWAVSLTAILAVGFIVSQLMLWKEMNQVGLYVEGGIFPSILHGFTWIHAGHLVVAIFLLLYLSYVTISNPFKKDRTLSIENIGMVWHFLGLVWLIMYLTIFVF